MTRRTAAPADAQHLTDRVRRVRTKKADSGAEVTALHRLHGAEDPLPEWQTDAAARYAHRHVPDLAAMLGLPVPARTGPADRLVTAATNRGAAGVRRWAVSASRRDIAAVRRVLRARRHQWKGRR